MYLWIKNIGFYSSLYLGEILRNWSYTDHEENLTKIIKKLYRT